MPRIRRCHYRRVIDQEDRVPRSASDVFRAWVATGIAVAVSTVVQVAYVLGADSSRLRLAEFTAVSLLVVFIGQFAVYQLLTWRAFDGLPAAELTRRVTATTPRSARARRREAWLGAGPKGWASTAALTALAAALLIAVNDELRTRTVLVVLSLVTVAVGWTMVAMAYALRYLRTDTVEGGLAFPGTEPPIWRDYVYLAVQVSTTFSTSDADVTSSRMRGQVTAHGLVAFVFNTVIVALLVSALIG